MAVEKVKLGEEFWKNGGWDTHTALKTKGHGHIDVYNGDPARNDCSLRIILSGNDKYFIEEESLPHTPRYENVIYSYIKESNEVWLYDSLDEVLHEAIKIASEVTGDSYEKLFSQWGNLCV